MTTGHLRLAAAVLERADRAQPWRRAPERAAARRAVPQLWLALLYEPRTPAAREKLVSRLRLVVHARDKFTCQGCGRCPLHDAGVRLRLCYDPLETACETCAPGRKVLTPAAAAALAASGC